MPTIEEINKQLKMRLSLKNKLGKELKLPIELVFEKMETGVESAMGIGNKYTFWEDETTRVTIFNSSQAFQYGCANIKKGWVVKIFKTDLGHWGLEIVANKPPFKIPDLKDVPVE